MSISTMILGESGTGKSTSLRNLSPESVLLIQAVRKPLPFRSQSWREIDKSGGSIYVSDDSATIINAMQKTRKDIIIIDDFQYVLANEYMRRSAENGFAKFTEIGRKAWDILMQANALAPHKRVYILAHSETTESGKTKAKTIGKMLDDKITIEGLFTIVLRTDVSDGKFTFRTKNNGSDTVKSPIGLFDTALIDNDLNAIDSAIVEYYALTKETPQ